MSRILFINDLVIGGGTEKLLSLYAPFFSQKGERVYVAAKGTRKEAIEAFGPDVCFVSMGRRSGKYRPWSLRWFFDRFISYCLLLSFLVWSSVRKFDIAVAMKENQPMILASRIRARRKIGWIQSDYRQYHTFDECYDSKEEELECFRKFDTIICVSDTAKSGVIQTVGDPENLSVCYNPIDSKFIFQRSMEPIPINKPDNKILFVSVGRLDAIKQYPMLINACAELEKSFDFELWIIGEGIQYQNIRLMLSKVGVHSVKLLGFCENPYPYMRIADCFVSSSKSESFGLAIQESLSLGVPVIAARCPAIEETLSKDYGIITENSVEGLVEAMGMVLRDKQILVQYQERIRKHYPEEDQFKKRMEDVYNAIMQ